METTWVADEQVIFVHPNGRRSPGRIAIGIPVRHGEYEVRCAVSLDGLETIGIKACGSSPMQALMLGLQLLGYRLHDFVSRGGKVVGPDPDDREPAGVLSMFRVLMRRPGDPPEPDPALAELDAELSEAKRRYEEESDEGEP
jgi:hypothetical protein